MPNKLDILNQTLVTLDVPRREPPLEVIEGKGYEAATEGADQFNSYAGLFDTEPKRDAWQRGYDRGKVESTNATNGK